MNINDKIFTTLTSTGDVICFVYDDLAVRVTNTGGTYAAAAKYKGNKIEDIDFTALIIYEARLGGTEITEKQFNEF